MESVFHFLENHNDSLFHIFLNDGVRVQILKWRNKMLSKRLLRSEAHTLSVYETVLACYASSSAAEWKSLAPLLRVVAYRVTVSHTHCLGTQLGLLTALCGMGTTERKRPGARELSQLAAVLESTGSRLGEGRFAVYALDLLQTPLESGASYEGHALILLQYTAPGGEVAYRLLQSYLNDYSLADYLRTEAAQPMGHQACLCWLEKLGRLASRGEWDEEKNGLYRTLFGVYLVKLRGERLARAIQVAFFCSESTVERFASGRADLAAVGRGARHFLKEECLDDEDYEKRLVGQFDPLILSVGVVVQ